MPGINAIRHNSLGINARQQNSQERGTILFHEKVAFSKQITKMRSIYNNKKPKRAINKCLNLLLDAWLTVRSEERAENVSGVTVTARQDGR